MEMPVPKCPNMCSNMRTHLIMRAKCPEYVHIIDLILIIDLIYVSMNQVLIIDPIIGQIFLECGDIALTPSPLDSRPSMARDGRESPSVVFFRWPEGSPRGHTYNRITRASRRDDTLCMCNSLAHRSQHAMQQPRCASLRLQ